MKHLMPCFSEKVQHDFHTNVCLHDKTVTNTCIVIFNSLLAFVICTSYLKCEKMKPLHLVIFYEVLLISLVYCQVLIFHDLIFLFFYFV